MQRDIDTYSTTQFPGMGGKLLEVLTLRLFDPKTRLWSLYWIASNTGRFDPPVVRSTKTAWPFWQRHVNSKPILVVFRWDARNKRRPVRGQAFSPDRQDVRMEFFNVSERPKEYPLRARTFVRPARIVDPRGAGFLASKRAVTFWICAACSLSCQVSRITVLQLINLLQLKAGMAHHFRPMPKSAVRQTNSNESNAVGRGCSVVLTFPAVRLKRAFCPFCGVAAGWWLSRRQHRRRGRMPFSVSPLGMLTRRNKALPTALLSLLFVCLTADLGISLK